MTIKNLSSTKEYLDLPRKQLKLVCTPLKFYTQNDESLLFEWLNKILSIKKVEGVGKELHLYIESKNISNDELLDLMGIFDRYKFNVEQLNFFKTKANEYLFEDDHK